MAENVILVDWEAFEHVDFDVPHTMRVGATLRSTRRVATFVPGNVSVKFWGDSVEFWNGPQNRKRKTNKAAGPSGDDHEIDFDIGAPKGDEEDATDPPISLDDIAGAGEAGAFEAGVEALFGDLDCGAVASDPIQEAAHDFIT